MQSILLLKPRLDIPFKESYIPSTRGKISKIRQYWNDFIVNRLAYHKNLGDTVNTLELPLWKITIPFIEFMKKKLNFDEVYIPHHSSESFDPNGELVLKKEINIKFYMQMSLPWLFQVDTKGWCANASNWPIKPSNNTNKDLFELLQRRQKLGFSKFEQPKIIDNYHFDYLKSGFILFPCQIPHDQTIRYHSDISVEQSLDITLRWCKENNHNLVIKPHPQNIESMKNLEAIVKTHNYGIWMNNININTLLEKCLAVFTVNSGVGLEGILHEKPIFCYGRSDYASVSHKIDSYESIDQSWRQKDRYISEYPAFINSYYNQMVSVRAVENLKAC